MAKSTDPTGRKRWYEYHCYEGEDSVDAESWRHTHQQVTVLHRLTNVDEKEVGKMYRVKFNDGFECDAFEDELVINPEKFYRPDYPGNKPGKQSPKRVFKSLKGVR